MPLGTTTSITNVTVDVVPLLGAEEFFELW